MDAPARGWSAHEVVGFVFPNQQEIDTPRGRATLFSAGMAPQFTKWNEQGFPISWLGSLVWKLVYADGAIVTPNEELSAAMGGRR